MVAPPRVLPDDLARGQAEEGVFRHVDQVGEDPVDAVALGPHVDPNGPPGTDSILTLSVAGTLTLRGR